MYTTRVSVYVQVGPVYKVIRTLYIKCEQAQIINASVMSVIPKLLCMTFLQFSYDFYFQDSSPNPRRRS